ncbi:MAG TPA: lysophospholipid acyltransferase family protein [Nitrospiraceae bacterium]|nr:lysophospholipid acyltransferase family protein [Nitrospiraceae bacterium]
MTAAVYGFLWILCNVLGRLLFHYRAVGREHVPRQGGVLVAANHASYLDIPLLGCGIPRRVAFLGRQDLFPGFRWLFRWLGWIPIRLDRLDREGFGKAIRLIRSGRVVAIYPEGRRTTDGRLQPGRQGIGIIVAETGCLVIPAYISGTREALPVGASWIRCHPVQVTYGEPIDFTTDTPRYSGKEFYRHVSRTVMAKIAELGRVTPPAEPLERAERPDTSPAAQPRNTE